MNFSFDTYLQTAPPTIILQTDAPKFTIVTANQAYLEAMNVSLQQLVGHGFLTVFPENPSDPVTKNVFSLSNSITEAIRTKKQHVLPSQKYDIPVWGTDRFNTRYWRTTNSPIINDAGEVEYIVLVTLDITSAIAAGLKERFTFEVAEEKSRATQQMEERLQLAIDSAEMGTWYMNAETLGFIASPRMKMLYGFEEESEMSYAHTTAQILPEYRKAVNEAVDMAISTGLPYQMEYPIAGFNDKKIRWIRATGKRYDAEGSDVAHFSGTIMDITQRKLEEMRKNDFLSIASHELKTPLTTLKASLQLLDRMKEKPLASMLPKLIHQCNKSMNKISSLVNELLNVSRITEGKLVLKITSVNLSEMVKGCCEHVTSGGTHEIIVEGDRDVIACADEERIDQVLVNLVNNAVKYADGSYKIYIIIEKNDHMVKISVKDSGPGIAKKHLDQLFNRYYRAETNNLQSSGLGLGLFICAEIIKIHGGQIGVESEIGVGSIFWFTIPLAEPLDRVS